MCTDGFKIKENFKTGVIASAFSESIPIGRFAIVFQAGAWTITAGNYELLSRPSLKSQKRPKDVYKTTSKAGRLLEHF